MSWPCVKSSKLTTRGSIETAERIELVGLPFWAQRLPRVSASRLTLSRLHFLTKVGFLQQFPMFYTER